MTSKKGSALLFVLGMIFAASVLSVGIIEYAGRAMEVRASSAWERELRADAYSALNAAIAVVREYSEIDEGIYSAEQGWGNPLADKRIVFENGTEAEVSITDESGKISLTSLTAEYLQKIFEGMDISSNDAQEMAECIVDWYDDNDDMSLNGAEYDDYETDAPKPPNRPIASFDEFKYIKKVKDVFFDENGNPNQNFLTFQNAVSLEYFKKTNINSANSDTLKLLLYIEEKDDDGSLYAAVRGEIGIVSDGIVWVKNAEELSARGATEVPSTLVQYKADLLKIDVIAKRGIGKYRLTAYCGTSAAISEYKNKIAKVYLMGESADAGTDSTSKLKSLIPLSATNENKSAADSKNASFKVFKITERGQ